MTVEKRSAKNTFFSSCSEQFKKPAKGLRKGVQGEAENASLWDQSSKKSQVVYHSKTNLPSGIQQMSSFERACYEDFQMYIPEITTETKFTPSSKLCEETADFGSVTSVPPAVNQDLILKGYPNSSSHKVLPNARHCFYNEGVEPFAFKGSNDKMPRSLGNCNYNISTPSSCRKNGNAWPQGIHPDLRFSQSAYSRPLKDTSQAAPPNKVVNHFAQQLCPTVSIRVDISCPLLPCGHKKMSCSCVDARTSSPMQPSYNMPGNLGQRSNGILRSDVYQRLPGVFNTKANSSTGTNYLSHASAGNRCYDADLSKCQFKSDDFSNTSINLYPPKYETTANNNVNDYSVTQKERPNDQVFNTDVLSQGGSYMTDYRTPSQITGSETYDSLNLSNVKYQDTMRYDRNFAEGFSTQENSYLLPDEYNGTSLSFPIERIQTNERVMHFPKSAASSCHDIVELRPVDPGKIFGQCKFQTSGSMFIDEKSTYAEPSVQNKTWQTNAVLVQPKNCTKIKSKEKQNESLASLYQPSSPIANLSSLVAKIHPEHGNITAGQKNVKLEGQSN